MILLTALIIATFKYFVGSFNWKDFYLNFYLANICLVFNASLSPFILNLLDYYKINVNINDIFNYMYMNLASSGSKNYLIKPSPYTDMPSNYSSGYRIHSYYGDDYVRNSVSPEDIVESIETDDQLESFLVFSDFKHKLIEDHQKDIKHWLKNISSVNRSLENMRLDIFERGDNLFERDEFRDNNKAHYAIIEKIKNGTLPTPIIDESKPTIRWINREKIKQTIEINKLNKDYCQWQMEKILQMKKGNTYPNLPEEDKEIINEHYKYFKIKFKELYHYKND
jgi:hypothetical protein